MDLRYTFTAKTDGLLYPTQYVELVPRTVALLTDIEAVEPDCLLSDDRFMTEAIYRFRRNGRRIYWLPINHEALDRIQRADLAYCMAGHMVGLSEDRFDAFKQVLHFDKAITIEAARAAAAVDFEALKLEKAGKESVDSVANISE